ncbi:MAG: hypothetical protein JXB39_07125, partial [Deltaproteobacteria bacterium]|nr:hypothetical protein [Deltaproteobacteria bacterium]
AGAVVALSFTAWGIESVFLGPVRWPVLSFEVDRPAHCAYLAARGEGAVIDLPLRVRPRHQGHPLVEGHRVEADLKAVRSRYLYEQTLHGLPVLAAVGSRLPNELEDLPVQDPLLTSLAIAESDTGDGRLVAPSGWNPDRLTQAGFRWIVLHLDLLRPILAVELEAELGRLLGDPVALGSTLVFRLPGETSASAAAPASDGDEPIHVARIPSRR